MFDELEDRKFYKDHVIDLGKNTFVTSQLSHSHIMGTSNESLLNANSFDLS